MFQEMKAALITDFETANIKVHDGAWSDRFEPPGVMVRQPISGSYIERGQLVGEFEQLIDVILVVPQSDKAVTDLDEFIETVLLNSVDWGFRGVDTVAVINIHGTDYPGTVIHLAKQARLYTP